MRKLTWRMTNAANARYEDHPNWAKLRHVLRIMTGA